MSTGISWTDETWNPWQGCTKISEECRYCYMFRDKAKHGQNPDVIARSSEQTFHKPYRLKTGTTVFTCSWSDFFHEKADAWRREAWGIIRECPSIRFIILTKRIERAADHLPNDWGNGYPNVCLGVTAGNQERFNERWEYLRRIPAAAYVISHEPALNMIDYPGDFLSLGKRGWVIAGGETGAAARPAHLWWIRRDRDQCMKAGVPFFFKSWGAWVPGVKRKKYDTFYDLQTGGCACVSMWKAHEWYAGGVSFFSPANVAGKNLLDGRTHEEFPEMPVEDPQLSLF